MKKNGFFLILIISSISFFDTVYIYSDNKKAEDLIYLTENYPPQNFIEDGKLQGISVDILKMIWKNMGVDLSTEDITLVPWARGFKDILTKDNIVLFGMGFSEERNKVLNWVGPYYSHSLVLIGKKSNKTTITAIEDIKKYKVGTIKDDIGDQVLLSKEIPDSNLYRANSMAAMLKMLNSGRTDLICYMEDTFFIYLNDQKISHEDYEIIYTVAEYYSGYGFSKDIPEELVASFQKELDKLIKSGDIDKIIKKYIKY